MTFHRATLLVCSLAAAAFAQNQKEPGLLFYLSGDQGLTADYAAGGDPAPNFVDKSARTAPGGAKGSYIECGDDQTLSYWAPGNIYAQRGTLAFNGSITVEAGGISEITLRNNRVEL